MTRIKSALSATRGDAQANAAEWRKLVDELAARRRAAAGWLADSREPGRRLRLVKLSR